MKSNLTWAFLFLVGIAVFIRWTLHATTPPSSPIRVLDRARPVFVNAVTLGTTYAELIALYGRPTDPRGSSGRVWDIGYYHDFQSIRLFRQDEAGDAWRITRVIGTACAQGGTPLVREGDSEERVAQALGESGTPPPADGVSGNRARVYRVGPLPVPSPLQSEEGTVTRVQLGVEIRGHRACRFTLEAFHAANR